MALFNPLLATAYDLQCLLENDKISSQKLVEIYYDEIKNHDIKLNSISRLASKEKILAQAKILDEERKNGIIRSNLHGIPIVVKESINTKYDEFEMDTTSGSLAFVDCRPKENAKIIDNLINAGLLIIGKANMTELNNYKGYNTICGWSAVGGQVHSAYIKGGYKDGDDIAGHTSTAGSSSGSAVAVSAGLSPISIGTDSCGSTTTPASRAALFGIKPTVGLISMDGCLGLDKHTDTPGLMTKSVKDLANLLTISVTDSTKSDIPKGGYINAMTNSWSDIRIGTVDPKLWKLSQSDLTDVEEITKQMEDTYEEAYKRMKPLVKSYKHHIPLIKDEIQLDFEGEFVLDIMWHASYDRTIRNYVKGLENPKVQNLSELIQFNKDHSDQELLPKGDDQKHLEDSLSSNYSIEKEDLARKFAYKMGREQGIDKLLKEYEIDVIFGPPESGICCYASAAGYPMINLPLGYVNSYGRPFGMGVITTAGKEALLIKVMSAWEATFPSRRPPPIENFY